MEDLMRKVKYLITEEARKINKDEPIFEESFFELVTDIEDRLAHGEDWFTKTREEGFTISAAEAEGYVRALREIKDTYDCSLKEIEERKR